MRRVGTLFVLVALLLGSAPTDAFAEVIYRDTGFDRDDVSGPAIDDVASTRRTVWTNANGRRLFTVKVRTYEPLGRNVDILVVLDYRGDRRRDARLSLSFREGDGFCGLNYPDGSGWIFRVQKLDRVISCTFRLNFLEPTKRIRWRVRSPDPGIIDPADVDFAPDTGWYS